MNTDPASNLPEEDRQPTWLGRMLGWNAAFWAVSVLAAGMVVTVAFHIHDRRRDLSVKEIATASDCVRQKLTTIADSSERALNGFDLSRAESMCDAVEVLDAQRKALSGNK